MEKKYPVLKCNEELWNEIKPVLESFGINNFEWIYNFEKYPFLISNYGFCDKDELVIGNITYDEIYKPNSIRYIVNTKEEFLSAVAKLLGKEYLIKEQSSEIKYPYIICTQQLYDRIKDILKTVGYEEDNINNFDGTEIFLIINYKGRFGHISNVNINYITSHNRYQCNTIKEFLTVACELQGFKVIYNTFVTDDNAENHYFKYVIDNNVIEINEIREDKGECSATVIRKKQWSKKLEKKDMVVSYDPTIGKDNTVVATMPAKSNDFDKNKGSDLDIDKPMEKINIADKLKHCKKGTKLYHLMFGEVEFDGIDNDDIFVITTNKDDEKGRYYVNSFGLYDVNYPNGECLLFPSKDNRDWNNFQVLEEGHRVMCSDDALCWGLAIYVKDNIVKTFTKNTKCYWKYIVPAEDFDFTAEDITINKEKSIV